MDAAHGPGTERFVEEVLWRSYSKGHLETRPELWSDHQRLTAENRGKLDAHAGLRFAFQQAVEGRTGIDGFDDWARELTETHWLHNHARMLSATI